MTGEFKATLRGLRELRRQFKSVTEGISLSFPEVEQIALEAYAEAARRRFESQGAGSWHGRTLDTSKEGKVGRRGKVVTRKAKEGGGGLRKLMTDPSKLVYQVLRISKASPIYNRVKIYPPRSKDGKKFYYLTKKGSSKRWHDYPILEAEFFEKVFAEKYAEYVVKKFKELGK